MLLLTKSCVPLQTGYPDVTHAALVTGTSAAAISANEARGCESKRGAHVRKVNYGYFKKTIWGSARHIRHVFLFFWFVYLLQISNSLQSIVSHYGMDKGVASQILIIQTRNLIFKM